MIHFVSDPTKIPESAILVLVNESIRYDDGYGTASNPSYSNLDYLCIAYGDTEEELKKYILELTKNNKTFTVLNTHRLTTKINVSIELE
jgi:hypothetical protein